MNYLEFKEDGLSLNGIALDEKTQCSIKTLSLIWGVDLKETCDRINQALQAFSDIWNTLKELVKRILEVLPQNEDICDLQEQEDTARQQQGRKAKKGNSKYQVVGEIQTAIKERICNL